MLSETAVFSTKHPRYRRQPTGHTCKACPVFVQAFASSRPDRACQALLFYMERCRVLEATLQQQPGHALALEVRRFAFNASFAHMQNAQSL